MHILFVNSFYWPDLLGGAERSVQRLVKLHIQAGDKVSVLTTHNGSSIKTETIDGATVIRIPPCNLYWAKQADQPTPLKRAFWHTIDSYNPLSGNLAEKIIRDINPDIISSQNLGGLSVSIWRVAKKLKIPLVQVLRDYYTICPRNTMYKDGKNCESICSSCSCFRIPHKSLSRDISAVVGCSNAVLEKHLKFGLYSDVKIRRVIYNAEHREENRTANRKSSTQFTLGYIGALTEVKGIPEMLKAFLEAKTKSQIPLKVIVAGDGPEGYVQYLKSRFSDPSIDFIGHASPHSLFEQCDATIVASVWDDPLPGVVFQALSSGIPVIGSNRGGIPEMITNGHNGILYDSNIEGDLRSAILTLANSPDLQEKLKSNARSSSEIFLDEVRLLREYENLYKEVLEGKSRTNTQN